MQKSEDLQIRTFLDLAEDLQPQTAWVAFPWHYSYLFKAEYSWLQVITFDYRLSMGAGYAEWVDCLRFSSQCFRLSDFVLRLGALSCMGAFVLKTVCRHAVSICKSRNTMTLDDLTSTCMVRFAHVCPG